MNEVRLWDWIVLDGRRGQVVALEGAIVEIEDATTLAHVRVPVGELVSNATVQEQRSSFSDLAMLERLTASERERCDRQADLVRPFQHGGREFREVRNLKVWNA